MANHKVKLEAIFREIGLEEYLDAFVEQGFDTWDTILDIQERDLDELGVKLGHRRKLQRKIAACRGRQYDTNLMSAGDGVGECKDWHNPGPGVVQKRRYRRHPKPDKNAPERPPSAYVLFANDIRNDERYKNLNFSEIAKLVGVQWKKLDPTQKQTFELKAKQAKATYHLKLANYRETVEYRQYKMYFLEFKKQQAQKQEFANRQRLPKSNHASVDYSALSPGSALFDDRFVHTHGKEPQTSPRGDETPQGWLPSLTELIPLDYMAGTSPPPPGLPGARAAPVVPEPGPPRTASTSTVDGTMPINLPPLPSSMIRNFIPWQPPQQLHHGHATKMSPPQYSHRTFPRDAYQLPSGGNHSAAAAAADRALAQDPPQGVRFARDTADNSAASMTAELTMARPGSPRRMAIANQLRPLPLLLPYLPPQGENSAPEPQGDGLNTLVLAGELVERGVAP